jgi:hypothetical protein
MKITAFDFNVFHVEIAGGEMLSISAIDQGVKIKTGTSEIIIEKRKISDYILEGKTIIKKGDVLNDHEKSGT